MSDQTTVVLKGDALSISRGICQQVVDPLVLQFAKGSGHQGVIELYASLITYLALDVVVNLNAETARHILACAGDRINDLVVARAADAPKGVH